MISGRSVAALAFDAGTHGIERKFFRVDCVRRMASETGDLLAVVHKLAGGIHEIRGLEVGRAHCEVETIDLAVVTDAALIEPAVLLEDIGLAGGSQAESPAY